MRFLRTVLLILFVVLGVYGNAHSIQIDNLGKFKYLKPIKGVHFSFSQRGIKIELDDPEVFGYTEQKARWLFIDKENAGLFFEPIKNIKQAKELCYLLHKGYFVESETQFQDLIKVYKEIGFDLKNSFENIHIGVELLDRKRDFKISEKKNNDSYDIKFTILNNRKSMNASISVVRFYYKVLPNNKIELVKKEDYINGPALSWQCEEGSSSCMTAGDHQMRQELSRQISTIFSKEIPQNIY